MTTTRHPSGLTTYQAVLQSWMCHPDWDVPTHIAWLEEEGYDLGALYGGTRAEIIGGWLDKMRAAAAAGRQAATAATRPDVAEVLHSLAVLARARITAAELEPGDQVLYRLGDEGEYLLGTVVESGRPHLLDGLMPWRVSIDRADGGTDTFGCSPEWTGARIVRP